MANFSAVVSSSTSTKDLSSFCAVVSEGPAIGEASGAGGAGGSTILFRCCRGEVGVRYALRCRPFGQSLSTRTLCPLSRLRGRVREGACADYGNAVVDKP